MANRDRSLIRPRTFTLALASLAALLLALVSACGGGGGDGGGDAQDGPTGEGFETAYEAEFGEVPPTSAPACQTDATTESPPPSPEAGLTLSVGSYEGTGSPQCIRGLGFQPVLVIIKGNAFASWTLWRSSSMEGDSTADFAAIKSNSFWQNGITSLDPDAFSLGKIGSVNAEGITYYYVAFADSPDIDVGSYIGDGVDGRTISVGFQPALVFLKPDLFRPAVWSSATHPEGVTSGFHRGDDATNFILGFEADGFKVGSDISVNGEDPRGPVLTYHYVAFREAPGRLETGTYIGDGSDNRQITDIGFQPDYVWIKRSSFESRAVHRPSSLPGDETLQFGNETNSADQIKALEGDGFRVGSHPHVNFDGDTYHYAAWKASNGP